MARGDTTGTDAADRRFVGRIMEEPLLSRERERELARRWCEHEDSSALHQLVASHGRLVVSIANGFRGYGLPIGDLIQEGNIGLLQAATRFDPDRGFRLSTYALWWIRAAIQEYVLRNWSVVRVGTTASEKALFFNLRRLRARITAASGGEFDEAGRARVAARLGVDEDAVERMEARFAFGDQSVNVALGEDGEAERQDFLIDDRPSPEDVVMDLHDGAARAHWLAGALDRLPPRERMIIRERHLTDEAATLAELGQELGISKERVRQLEGRALARLRHLAAHDGGWDGVRHHFDRAPDPAAIVPPGQPGGPAQGL